MPRGVAMDKNGKLFKTGDKVHCSVNKRYGTVVQIEAASDKSSRNIWVQTPGKENFQTRNIVVTVIKRKGLFS